LRTLRARATEPIKDETPAADGRRGFLVLVPQQACTLAPRVYVEALQFVAADE
jgi:hypothetical protein